MTAGPVWDFDWGTFPPKPSFTTMNYLYFGRLFMDDGFKAMVKDRWNSLKASLQDIPAFIDSTASYLRKSEALNSEMWPNTSNVNGDESMSFDQAVSRLKKSYEDKLNWMTEQINAW